MSDEELFCKLFPEYAVNGKPLSPYFDLFESGFEQSEKRIADLENKLTEKVTLESLDVVSGKIKQLEKENAELKSRECWKACEYANPKSELIGQHIKDVQNLTKAREIINEYINILKGDTKNWKKTQNKAEQFLKDSEVEK